MIKQLCNVFFLPFSTGPFWGLLCCSSSFLFLLSLHCVFIGQVSCSLSSAQAKGRDVVNQAGEDGMLVLPHFRALLQLCSVHCDKNLRRYLNTPHSENEIICICNLCDPLWMHIAPQNVPLSTKLV